MTEIVNLNPIPEGDALELQVLVRATSGIRVDLAQATLEWFILPDDETKPTETNALVYKSSGTTRTTAQGTTTPQIEHVQAKDYNARIYLDTGDTDGLVSSQGGPDATSVTLHHRFVVTNVDGQRATALRGDIPIEY